MTLKIHMNPHEKLTDAYFLVLLHEIHIKQVLGMELVSIKMTIIIHLIFDWIVFLAQYETKTLQNIAINNLVVRNLIKYNNDSWESIILMNVLFNKNKLRY